MDLSKLILEKEKRIDISGFFPNDISEEKAYIIIQRIPELNLRILKTTSAKRLDVKMMIESQKRIEKKSFEMGFDYKLKPDNDKDLKKWQEKATEIQTFVANSMSNYYETLTQEELEEANGIEIKTEKSWFELGIKEHNLENEGKKLKLDYDFWTSYGKAISNGITDLKEYVLNEIIKFNYSVVLGE